MGAIDKRDRFASDVFAYRATKDGKVLFSWEGRHVTTLAGEEARRFLRKVDGLDRREAQLLMARVTGNFKHGNERSSGPS